MAVGGTSLLAKEKTFRWCSNFPICVKVFLDRESNPESLDLFANALPIELSEQHPGNKIFIQMKCFGFILKKVSSYLNQL